MAKISDLVNYLSASPEGAELSSREREDFEKSLVQLEKELGDGSRSLTSTEWEKIVADGRIFFPFYGQQRSVVSSAFLSRNLGDFISQWVEEQGQDDGLLSDFLKPITQPLNKIQRKALDSDLLFLFGFITNPLLNDGPQLSLIKLKSYLDESEKVSAIIPPLLRQDPFDAFCFLLFKEAERGDGHSFASPYLTLLKSSRYKPVLRFLYERVHNPRKKPHLPLVQVQNLVEELEDQFLVLDAESWVENFIRLPCCRDKLNVLWKRLVRDCNDKSQALKKAQESYKKEFDLKGQELKGVLQGRQALSRIAQSQLSLMGVSPYGLSVDFHRQTREALLNKTQEIGHDLDQTKKALLCFIKAVSLMAVNQKVLDDEDIEGVTSQVSLWNYTNSFVDGNEVTKVIEAGDLIVKRVISIYDRVNIYRMDYEKNPQSIPAASALQKQVLEYGPLSRRELSTPGDGHALAGQMASLWLFAADERNWSEKGATIWDGEIRKRFISTLPALIDKARRASSNEELVEVNQLLQEVLTGTLLAESENEGFQVTFIDMSLGFNPISLLKKMPASHREPLDQVFQLSEEIRLAQDMEEDLMKVGGPSHSPNQQVAQAANQLIIALEKSRRGLWYSYKQHRLLSRMGSQIAYHPSMENLIPHPQRFGDIEEIKEGIGKINELILLLQKSQSPQEIKEAMGLLVNQLTHGEIGVAFEEAVMDGIEHLIGLCQSTLILLATGGFLRMGNYLFEWATSRVFNFLSTTPFSLTEEGWFFLAEHAFTKAMQAKKALKVVKEGEHLGVLAKMGSAFAAGMGMGILEDVASVSSNQARQSTNDFFDWFKDGLSTGFSMSLSSLVLPGHMARKELAQDLMRRWVDAIPHGMGTLTYDMAIEAVEEAIDQYARQCLEGNFIALSWNQLRELTIISFAGGGMKIKGLRAILQDGHLWAKLENQETVDENLRRLLQNLIQQENDASNGTLDLLSLQGLRTDGSKVGWALDFKEDDKIENEKAQAEGAQLEPWELEAAQSINRYLSELEQGDLSNALVESGTMLSLGDTFIEKGIIGPTQIKRLVALLASPNPQIAGFAFNFLITFQKNILAHPLISKVFISNFLEKLRSVPKGERYSSENSFFVVFKDFFQALIESQVFKREHLELLCADLEDEDIYYRNQLFPLITNEYHFPLLVKSGLIDQVLYERLVAFGLQDYSIPLTLSWIGDCFELIKQARWPIPMHAFRRLLSQERFKASFNQIISFYCDNFKALVESGYINEEDKKIILALADNADHYFLLIRFLQNNFQTVHELGWELEPILARIKKCILESPTQSLEEIIFYREHLLALHSQGFFDEDVFNKMLGLITLDEQGANISRTRVEVIHLVNENFELLIQWGYLNRQALEQILRPSYHSLIELRGFIGLVNAHWGRCDQLGWVNADDQAKVATKIGGLVAEFFSSSAVIDVFMEAFASLRSQGLIDENFIHGFVRQLSIPEEIKPYLDLLGQNNNFMGSFWRWKEVLLLFLTSSHLQLRNLLIHILKQAGSLGEHEDPSSIAALINLIFSFQDEEIGHLKSEVGSRWRDSKTQVRSELLETAAVLGLEDDDRFQRFISIIEKDFEQNLYGEWAFTNQLEVWANYRQGFAELDEKEKKAVRKKFLNFLEAQAKRPPLSFLALVLLRGRQLIVENFQKSVKLETPQSNHETLEANLAGKSKEGAQLKKNILYQLFIKASRFMNQMGMSSLARILVNLKWEPLKKVRRVLKGQGVVEQNTTWEDRLIYVPRRGELKGAVNDRILDRYQNEYEVESKERLDPLNPQEGEEVFKAQVIDQVETHLAEVSAPQDKVSPEIRDLPERVSRWVQAYGDSLETKGLYLEQARALLQIFEVHFRKIASTFGMVFANIRVDLIGFVRGMEVGVKIGKESEAFIVSGDLESLARSGSEPVATCQTLEFGWVNMRGEPLHRMMHEQFKVAFWKVDGVILARRMLEITIDEEGHEHLLVERLYVGAGFARVRDFRKQILDYATEYLGIDESRVHFNDEISFHTAPAAIALDDSAYRDSFLEGDLTLDDFKKRHRINEDNEVEVDVELDDTIDEPPPAATDDNFRYDLERLRSATLPLLSPEEFIDLLQDIIEGLPKNIKSKYTQWPERKDLSGLGRFIEFLGEIREEDGFKVQRRLQQQPEISGNAVGGYQSKVWVGSHQVELAAVTEGGLSPKRDINQDAFLVFNQDGRLVVLVLDGVGATFKPEILTFLVTRIFNHFLSQGKSVDEALKILKHLLSFYESSSEGGDTTLLVAEIFDLSQGVSIQLRNAGDSKAYVSNPGQPIQETLEDNVYGQRLRLALREGNRALEDELRSMHPFDPQRLTLTRTLRVGDDQDFDSYPAEGSAPWVVKSNGYFVLLTDGVTDILTHQEICDVLNHAKSAQDAKDTLERILLIRQHQNNLLVQTIQDQNDAIEDIFRSYATKNGGKNEKAKAQKQWENLFDVKLSSSFANVFPAIEFPTMKKLFFDLFQNLSGWNESVDFSNKTKREDWIQRQKKSVMKGLFDRAYFYKPDHYTIVVGRVMP